MDMSNNYIGERVSVVETQVKNINEKLDDLKNSIDSIRELTVANREHLLKELDSIHADVNKRVGDVEKFNNKWYYIVVGGTAVAGFALGHVDLARIFLK
jgi:chaperonin cofactor prefoldin